MCKYCRRYEKQMQLLHEGVGHYADSGKNPDEQSILPAAKERIRQALIQEMRTRQ